jgi:hypothetical protein
MPVKKISISIDSRVAAAARAAADAEGISLSAWLSRAAEHAASMEAMRQGIEEYEQECGPITEEDLREAAKILDAPPPPETEEQRKRREALYRELYGDDSNESDVWNAA